MLFIKLLTGIGKGDLWRLLGEGTLYYGAVSTGILPHALPLPELY